MAEHSIPPANQNVTADQVADYLSEHPDFLNDYPELLGKLNPPRRDMGETVTDLQQSMISHLRSQVERTEDLAHVMIANSRDNLSSTTQIHECVLRLMAAESFEDLISTIENDLPAILELDYVAVCIENDDMTLRPAYGIRSIPTTLIDFLIPENKEIILNDNTLPDPNVYGAATDLVKSEALVRLDISPEVPP
ncbi:MAG: DUF484 family protein, partial [Alphaproteobacteria bacterium]|nr:DUF484 family protein [Alphaproteobacteria bacterium]